MELEKIFPASFKNIKEIVNETWASLDQREKCDKLLQFFQEAESKDQSVLIEDLKGLLGIDEVLVETPLLKIFRSILAQDPYTQLGKNEIIIITSPKSFDMMNGLKLWKDVVYSMVRIKAKAAPGEFLCDLSDISDFKKTHLFVFIGPILNHQEKILIKLKTMEPILITKEALDRVWTETPFSPSVENIIKKI